MNAAHYASPDEWNTRLNPAKAQTQADFFGSIIRIRIMANGTGSKGTSSAAWYPTRQLLQRRSNKAMVSE
jgi:hypothetical protein